MARLTTSRNTPIWEYVGPVAMGLALVACMPLLGIAAFLLRGVVVAAFAAALTAAAAIAIWQWLEPKLSPGVRLVVRDVTLGVALVLGVPLLAVAVLVAQGAAVALFPVAAVTLAILGICQIFGAGRHALKGP